MAKYVKYHRVLGSIFVFLFLSNSLVALADEWTSGTGTVGMINGVYAQNTLLININGQGKVNTSCDSAIIAFTPTNVNVDAILKMALTAQASGKIFKCYVQTGGSSNCVNPPDDFGNTTYQKGLACQVLP